MREGHLETVTEDSRFVRLGSGVDTAGRLDPVRKEAGISAIRELVGQAHDAGANSVWAVATSALRDAADGEEYIHQIHQVTGIAVRIIDGEEEARLTFTGATLGMNLAGGALVCDMGGGSCELIQADESGITLARSLQVGSGRLTERFVRHDPPVPSERQRIEEYVDSTIREEFGHVSVKLAVLTGGTASHVAYLLGLEGAAVVIQSGQLVEAETLVYELPSGEIAQRYQVRPERAEVLPAGITAIRTIAVRSGSEKTCISRRGIREGVLMEALTGRWPQAAA